MKLLARLQRGILHLRIGTRLSLAFAAVLGLTALIGVFAVVNLARVNSTATNLAQNWMPGLATTGTVRALMLEFRELEVKHARSADTSYMAEYEDKMKDTGNAVATHIDEYARLVDDSAERELFDQLKAKWAEYQGFAKKVVAAGRSGKSDDARELGDGAAKVAADEAVALVDKLSAHNVAGGTAEAALAATAYRQARLWTLAGVVAVLTLGAGLAWLITRGLLAQLGGEPATAAAVARAVAEGDLSTRIPLKAGDRESLMAALQHMQDSLINVVASVRQGSEQVATASSQIAQGNGDLSSRTEQQASALQQTAASMEELGTTVNRNAEHARRADDLARGASEVARRGGDAVTRVVQTMRGINESSRRIADIVGTIDGIAFQTNILALNAAVEAARAGEQGRGFAVVASEVRSLAQRSASAAREIKGLIAASVERVEQGTSQVDEAGTTMQEVVGSIDSVTRLMSEISTASREQSAGVAQVGEAVSQMDRTTQQNAALVEQSAAAAESLRQQAQELVQVVAAFRLQPSAAG
jgi:methyl-accepting chemotaxis protein